MNKVEALLEKSAALHHHLCPRQVLGVRMGLVAGDYLGVEVPQTDKRLLAFVETDGCGADGIAVATGCWLGRRTMRLYDYGKLAFTLIDSYTGQAVRVSPQPDSRQKAAATFPQKDKWTAQLEGYKILPTADLLRLEAVSLSVDLEKIISKAGLRAVCEACGEEIMNEREVIREGMVLCRACVGEAYYWVESRQIENI